MVCLRVGLDSALLGNRANTDFLFMQNHNGVLQIADDVSNFILSFS
jgi:hypothetical protein